MEANKKQIAPSLLACDFGNIEKQLKILETAGCEYLHLDVMDGVFVPNISFGQPLIKSIRKCTNMKFDTHLMIVDPIRYIDTFADCGSDMITIHIESCDNVLETLRAIRARGVKAGLSVKPNTPVSAVEPYIGEFDLLLVMSVEPGFGGQKFMPESIAKVRDVNELRAKTGADYIISIDGGIGESNIAEVARAGADLFVAGSSVLGNPDISQAFKTLSEKVRS